MGALLLILLLLILLPCLLLIASQWKIFTKAEKPGWACLIPIYSGIVLLEVIKKPTWWIFMFFIPLVNIYFAIVAVNELSKAFGKSTGFTLGLIFLPFIFYPILAFGSAQYVYIQTSEVNEIGTPQV
ncbi:DUF5684 domain-containing protein [Flavobacterium enshiense]|uniref:DUF5684 domain-containing protein n=1 Tax=Flavobacterium enshiense TaxID=1341165 RepID=UPI00345D388F